MRHRLALSFMSLSLWQSGFFYGAAQAHYESVEEKAESQHKSKTIQSPSFDP